MARDTSITAAILEFCRFLRSEGFSVGIQETTDALRAVVEVNISDRVSVKLALKTILCASKEEAEEFDLLFDTFWNRTDCASPICSRPAKSVVQKVISVEGNVSRPSEAQSGNTDNDSKRTVGASAIEKMKQTDFAKLPSQDLVQLEEIAFRLWKRMSTRLIRRERAGERAERLDFRRTIRAGTGRGGDWIDLRFRGRKQRRLHLITLLDVSGSMDLYSMFLLRFVYALHKYFKRIDSFTFGTRLTYLGRSLKHADLKTTMGMLSRTVEDWSGGTRIGESLREFNRKYARNMVSRNTLVLILSDGWDTGEPTILAEELRSLKKRARKLIWMNPLLGSENYQPLTRGMAAALPFTDIFIPAHTLQSLIDLERYL